MRNLRSCAIALCTGQLSLVLMSVVILVENFCSPCVMHWTDCCQFGIFWFPNTKTENFNEGYFSFMATNRLVKFLLGDAPLSIFPQRTSSISQKTPPKQGPVTFFGKAIVLDRRLRENGNMHSTGSSNKE